MTALKNFVERQPTYAGVVLMLVWAFPMIVYALLTA